jgi:hypothetical protein
MNSRHGITCGIVLLLVASVNRAAYAERWIQAGPAESRLWYDADSIHPTGNRLIGVWISSGPSRTNSGAGGVRVYPTYSIVNCRERTAGSKISVDLGEALQAYAASTGMGELIAKLCP